MSKLTRNWLVATAVILVLLIYSFTNEGKSSTIAAGIAVLLSLFFVIERIDNWERYRKGQR